MTQTRSVIDSSNITLGAILITKNEAHQIKECLDSLNFCDEIILVDNGSEDETLTIARASGCRIVQTPDWPGYGIQKQRALNEAKSQWILSIDADERVTPELREEILRAIEASAFEGYFIKRRSQFLGRWMRFGGWYPDYVLRLGRRSSCRFDESQIHEKMIVNGRTGRLRNHYLHYAYDSISDVLAKQQRYAILGSKKIYLKSFGRASIFSAISHSVWTFLRLYLLQLGFFDGRQGFISAAFKSQETFWKYIASEFEPQETRQN